MQIKLFIIGDVRLHRDGLAMQLAEIPDLEVIGAGPLSAALEAMRTAPADVVLLDSLQLAISGVVESLRQPPGRVRIVAVGVREVESEVLACAAAGVDGYVRMDAGVEDLSTIIGSLMRGEMVCSPKVAASLYQTIAAGSVESGGAGLTSRELEIVELVNQGLSNKEISRQLSIETCTAKNHIQNIMQKLGVHRRGQVGAKLRRFIGSRLA
ncbi:MAG TPA: response regulator transcription factor [Caulobacteraceae bacterium]